MMHVYENIWLHFETFVVSCFVFDEIFIPSTENELCKDNQGSLKYLN